LDQLLNLLAKFQTRGITARIPYCYSEELNQIVKQMLKVDPKLRPSAAMIIQVIERLKLDPNLIRKLSEEEKNMFTLNDLNNMTLGHGGLLGTIAVPQDFGKIEGILP
jgi:hypothetical protein